jgi:uncharacterized protein (TIGR02147 family)
MQEPAKITLSPAQLEVVHMRGCHVQVIACAGSGKTESVSRRVAALIGEGVKSDEIVAFTFTDRAATELKERIVKRVAELEESRRDYFMGWHHMVVRELVTLEGFRPDPEWIARKLRGRITREEAKESLDLLQKLGFVKKDREKFVLSEPLLTSGDEVSNQRVAPLIQNIHRQMSEHAMRTMAEEAKEWREINGLTIAVPLSRIPDIKDAIKRFRRELNQTFSGEEKNDAVYYLSVQFFPLTTLGERREN